jgi:hypothetical protein
VPRKGQVVPKASQAAAAREHEERIEVRVVAKNGCRRRLDHVRQVRIRPGAAQRGDERCGEHDITDEPWPDEEDLQDSIVASSISMTGMSSWMGYTRRHSAHLRAVPFLTRVTGVLQFGQARISSSCASMGIGWLRRWAF